MGNQRKEHAPLGNEGFLVIESRRYPKSRLNQEQAAGLAFRMEEFFGASGGILVSPLGFQEGGKKLAEAKNIANSPHPGQHE